MAIDAGIQGDSCLVEELKFKVSPIVKHNMTVRIKVIGLKTLRFRLWCGRQLFKLAARVIGCNIVIETEAK